MNDGFDKAAFVPGSQKKKKRPWDIPSTTQEKDRDSRTKQTKPVQEQAEIIQENAQTPGKAVADKNAADHSVGQGEEKIFKPVGLADMTAVKKEESLPAAPTAREPVAAAEESPVNHPSKEAEEEKTGPTGQADIAEEKKEESAPPVSTAQEPAEEAPAKEDTTATEPDK